jgi:hypothetical protein
VPLTNQKAAEVKPWSPLEYWSQAKSTPLHSSNPPTPLHSTPALEFGVEWNTTPSTVNSGCASGYIGKRWSVCKRAAPRASLWEAAAAVLRELRRVEHESVESQK